MAETKTNAVRIVESAGIECEETAYECDGQPLDGVSVAAKLGVSVETVFKTLVTVGRSGGHFVFVIPAAEELDLKKAARACGEKAVEMIPVKEINRVTGYVRGGCSPVGMKKPFPTYIDETAVLCERIYVSAGRIGSQLHLRAEDLAGLIGARFCYLTAT